jgi:hypothetical protein
LLSSVPIGTLWGMESAKHILAELNEYSAATGLDPKIVCRRATNNPRLYDRLIARVSRLDRDVETLRRFMAENPAQSEEVSQ